MDTIKPQNKTPKILVALIGVGLTIGLFLGVRNLGANYSHSIEHSTLDVGMVAETLFEDYIPLRVTVEPLKSVFVDAVEGGQVEQIFIEEGSRVKAGDVILKLSNNHLQLDVVSQEAEISRQIGNLHDTRLAIEKNTLQLNVDLIEVEYEIEKYTRLMNTKKDLRSKALVAQLDYENDVNEVARWNSRKAILLENKKLDQRTRKTQLNQLQENIDRLQKNLAVVGTILDKLNVRAHSEGQLTSLTAELGQSIIQGQRIGQIDTVDQFRTTANLSEHYLDRVQVGQTTEILVNARTYLQRIVKIYPEVSNGQFKIDLEFVSETPANIRRGQSFSTKLQLSESGQILTIENGPFITSTGGSWVYVYEPNLGIARKRAITIGRLTPSQVEIIDGLRPGERVITSSYENFNSAEKLNIKSN